jgi:energy-coupling factor transporter ATP-binding protein EcfA2
MHWMAGTAPKQGNETPLFALRHLSFTYADNTPALRDITLCIFPGDRIALVGQNGSGKSTLARHLNGLVPVQHGELNFKGHPLTPVLAEEMRLQVGVLFQDPDDHLFCNTLYEDVAFGPRNQGRSESEVDRLVRDTLTAVGLERFLFKPAHHLSYGQKKRAALATILAMKPEVLILDEPTANLDPRQESIFQKLLQAYTGTLVIIEHDLLFLFDLCNRAIVLANGAVHHDYRFNDLVSQPQALHEHGLDFTFRFTCCNHHGVVGQHQHHHPTHEHGANGSHLPVADHATPLIELQHYSFHYPDTTPGIRDINLGLFANETIALVGENGAGKSTLAFCLLGLQQGKGYFLFEGQPLNGRRRRSLWQRVGMVFQHAADQLFCPSCWEEVAFGPQQMGWPAATVAARVADALDRVGLSGFEQRVPLHLSGGERKRLAIAAVLSMQPELLILDEPTAGLDPRSEALLLAMLEQLPMAKMLITHDLFFIRQLSNRTLVMHQGRIIRDYGTEEFLVDEHLQAINGLDYTYKNSCFEEIMDMQRENGNGR